MPYIDKDARWLLHHERFAETKGELNFLITELMIEYMKNNGKSYQVLSDIVGAGIDAAEEFRRRVLNPYEDEKIKENGDVYE